MKHQIKHLFTDAVLFECEVPDNIESGTAMRRALEKATQARAYLAGASLDGANLARASLDGAKLGDATLIGDRPIFQMGPIGSRCAYLVSYLTDQGVKIKAGCFFGSLDEFTNAVTNSHGDSVHGKEYLAAIQMIETHAQLWGSK